MNSNYIKSLIVVLALSATAIFGTSIYYRFYNPDLVLLKAKNVTQAGMGDMGAMLGALMQRVQENPNDMESAMLLTETFLQGGDYVNAETFAKKAQIIDPSAFLPKYLTAIAIQAQSRNEEAAAMLESMLEKNDDISARYSLGMIYIHYLQNPAKGKEHFEKAMSSPSLTGDKVEDIQKAIQEELAKL